MDRLFINESSRITASVRGCTPGTHVPCATARDRGHAPPRECDSPPACDHVHRPRRGSHPVPARQRRSATSVRRSAGGSETDEPVGFGFRKLRIPFDRTFNVVFGDRAVARRGSVGFGPDRRIDRRSDFHTGRLEGTRGQITRAHSVGRSPSDRPGGRFSPVFSDSEFGAEARRRHLDRPRNPHATSSRHAATQLRHLHANA